jgi:hypothetical protein
LNNSLRSPRRRTVVGGVILALALGGLAAALPAQASATSSKITHGYPSPITSAPGVSDSLNPGGLTAPDAIVTCATSRITISGTDNLTVPVGCLTLYNGEWVKVTWASPEMPPGEWVSTELSQQTDGNLVLTVSGGPVPSGGGNPTTTTTLWSSGTTFQGNPAGPGCLAQFQVSADLVVDNCSGASIWNSSAHTDANAVLAFQHSGGLVIYESSAGTILWSS